jgi:CheY-like chemotaxis protein
VDKVLIVDDSVMLIKYLEKHFQRYSDKFDFVTAKDGLEAMEILKEEPISLLVTDLQMPRADGLVLLAHTHQHHPTIPCIVMSAHGTPKIKEALQQDILQFIEKPFTAEQLAEVIISALTKGGPDGSLSGISIVSFLQMVEMEQKTCLCEIDDADNLKGFFYFQGGVLYHAVCGNLKGEEAAIKMMQVENPTISFRKPPERQIPRVIRTDLMALILEAVRQKDES